MFENDRMMRELHEFRRQDYKATKSLFFEEIERIRNERIRNRLKGTDYNLVELEDGTSMIVKKS